MKAITPNPSAGPKKSIRKSLFTQGLSTTHSSEADLSKKDRLSFPNFLPARPTPRQLAMFRRESDAEKSSKLPTVFTHFASSDLPEFNFDIKKSSVNEERCELSRDVVKKGRKRRRIKASSERGETPLNEKSITENTNADTSLSASVLQKPRRGRPPKKRPVADALTVNQLEERRDDTVKEGESSKPNTQLTGRRRGRKPARRDKIKTVQARRETTAHKTKLERKPLPPVETRTLMDCVIESDTTGPEEEEAAYGHVHGSDHYEDEEVYRRVGYHETSLKTLGFMNPLPSYIDALTQEPVQQPMISPYGHVLDKATWIRVLQPTDPGSPRGMCPFTKQPLHKRDLQELTIENIEKLRPLIREIHL